MAKVPIKVTVNGEEHSTDVEPRMLLVHFLREALRLTGTHIGCDTSHCGACTVVMDGRAVKSCTVFAIQADGRSITTVEGLEHDGKLHPLQDGFFQEHGLQCGYCTPGMLMTGYAFLKQTAVETPNWETDKTCTPSPHHPLGAKGVGESATVGAPAAIVNAVVDALWHLGVRHIDIPITSAKVWKLLRDAGVRD